MSGYYIIPKSGFTGGTVSGDTIFLSDLSANTIYLNNTPIQNVFAASGTNIGSGTIEVFAEKNNGFLEFKTISGGSNITIQQTVDTITISSAGSIGNINTQDIIEFDSGTTTLSTVYNTSIPDATNSVPVGGAPSLPASVWKTYNMVDVLDQILFPTLLPTYVIPTLVLSSSITGIREVGSNFSPNLSIVGTKNDAGNFTTLTINRTFNSIITTLGVFTNPTTATTTNIPNQFGFPDPNNPNITFTSTYSESYTIPPPPSSYFSSTVYGGSSIYLSGLTKQDNKSNFDSRPYLVRSVNAPQASSNNLNSNNITILGIYPFFYGTATTQPSTVDIANAIQAGNANAVLIDAQGTLSIDFNASNVYLWFAHNAANTTKQKWFETVNNSGNIGSPTDLFNAPTIQNVSSPLGYWNNIPFKVYISNYPTSTTVPPRTVPVTEMRNN